MNKQRIEWVDMAKGYGMLLVIFAHVFEKQYAVHWYIYSFHMPLFFMLSGYFLNCEKPFGEYIKGKAKSLLIPLYTWGLIDVLWGIARALYKLGTADLQTYGTTVSYQLLFQYPLSPGWFLACLFVASLILYPIAKKTASDRKATMIMCLIPALLVWLFYSPGRSPWSINTAIIAMFFMSIGYWAKTIDMAALLDKCFKPIIIIPVTVVWLVIATWMWKTKNYLEMSECYLSVFPVTIIAAALGSLVLLAVAKRKTFKSVIYIGENSVIYMLIHITLIKVLVEAAEKHALDNWGIRIAILVVVLAIDTAVVILRNRIKGRKSARVSA